MFAAAAFYVFSTIMLVSAAMVIGSRNPVHGVLFLIVTFFNAAALFLTAGAEFLALILVIVYVGAVMVLFLFVVMMLDIDFVALRSGFQRYARIGLAIAVVLLAELGMVLTGWAVAPESHALRGAPQTPGVTNTEQLGRLIYTDYIMLFQACGLVLLVAMIGAIVLTLREGRATTRRQKVARQTARLPAETMTMVRAPLGEGITALGIQRPLVIEQPAEIQAHPLDLTHVGEDR